ncbi:MAG: RnfABCDGE type electron transport complex subunit G [Mariprofundaceae bacterium]
MEKFKFEREQVQMVLALLAVAVVAVLFLGLTDIITREPIAEARKAALHKALVQVLPSHANDPQADLITLKPAENGHPADKSSRKPEAKQFYPAKNAEGNIIGLAWEAIAPDGYSGTIRILMGVLPDGSVHAIRITDHRETPGLGDGIVLNATWLDSFRGRTMENSRWAVKKDGGEFDQFTGATITPRAVIKAVRKGLDLFKTNRQRLLFSTPVPAPASAPTPPAEPADNKGENS